MGACHKGTMGDKKHWNKPKWSKKIQSYEAHTSVLCKNNYNDTCSVAFTCSVTWVLKIRSKRVGLKLSLPVLWATVDIVSPYIMIVHMQASKKWTSGRAADRRVCKCIRELGTSILHYPQCFRHVIHRTCAKLMTQYNQSYMNMKTASHYVLPLW